MMFPPAISCILSLALMVATALTGVVHNFGACEVVGAQCGSSQCCGGCSVKTRESKHACCSTPKHSQACRCSAENGRPAAPDERRPSDERDDIRRAESAMAILFVFNDEVRTLLIEDATLFSSLSATRRQAVLCCWLI
jgi:hypothetical protein